MCYHVSNQLEIEFYPEKLKRPVNQQYAPYKKYYDASGFINPFLPVISNITPREINMYRWKLIPNFGYVKTESDFKANTLNCRNDTLFEKPSYFPYWQNRCLMIVSGFQELHYPYLPKTKPSESWYIKPAEGEFFYLGAIYNFFNGVPTFTMITTEGNERLKWIHNDPETPGRHPLILNPDDAKKWILDPLTKNQMEDLMWNNIPDSDLITYRTIDGIYNSHVNTDVPEAILPIETNAA